MKDFPIIPASKVSFAARRPVCGVGINDADYMVRPKINNTTMICPFYNVWSHMIDRCYNPKRMQDTKGFVMPVVCDEWHVFSVFSEWMSQQDWVGKDLDKDIVKKGNRIYSPETCIFVSHHVNNLLNDSKSSRGECKIGVSKNKRSGKYEAYVNDFGRKIFLGFFNCENEAHEEYAKAKYEIIKRFAMEQKDDIVMRALMNRARELLKP